MSWRFRKSVKVFPGVRVNFSTRGISTTVGVRGAHVTFSDRGTYLNTGLPGTGISYRTRLDAQPAPYQTYSSPGLLETQLPPTSYVAPVVAAPVLEGAIKSAEVGEITSPGLHALKQLLVEAHTERAAIEKEIASTEANASSLEMEVFRVRRKFLAKYLYKKQLQQLEQSVTDAAAKKAELKEQLHLATVDVAMPLEGAFADAHTTVKTAFREMQSCQRIWDVTSEVANYVTKSAGGSIIARTLVTFDFKQVDIIHGNEWACHLGNANGGDVYIYPGFIVVLGTNNQFALLDVADIDAVYSDQSFIESDAVPQETATIGQTWERVNKNGTPDRRFVDNRLLPIVQYGVVTLKTSFGLNEQYMFSNPQKAYQFVEAFNSYRALMAGHAGSGDSHDAM